MTDLDLIRMQLELERIGFDEHGDLVRLPGPNPDDLGRLYVYRHSDGYSVYFRRDVPRELRVRLNDLSPQQLLDEPGLAQSVLAPCPDLWHGRSYTFPEMRPALFPDAVRLGPEHAELVARYDPELTLGAGAVYGVLVGGEIVSTCQSSRENEHAGEAWVRTLAPFRGRGYARQVTAAWAHELQRLGKTPFYSHSLANRASTAVARSLELRQFAEGAVYL